VCGGGVAHGVIVLQEAKCKYRGLSAAAAKAPPPVEMTEFS
jgi:hypothetical protein